MKTFILFLIVSVSSYAAEKELKEQASFVKSTIVCSNLAAAQAFTEGYMKYSKYQNGESPDYGLGDKERNTFNKLHKEFLGSVLKRLEAALKIGELDFRFANKKVIQDLYLDIKGYGKHYDAVTLRNNLSLVLLENDCPSIETARD